MRKGFTLIEVLIVIIIIGILATIALPQFKRTVERARRGEALSNLAAIQTGLSIYRLEHQTYTNCADTLAINNTLDCDIRQRDWTYSVENASKNYFGAVATRASGDYSGTRLRVTSAGNWDTSNYPYVP